VRTRYHRLTIGLKTRVVALMFEENVQVTDREQCLDVINWELNFAVVGVVGIASFQWASEYDEGEF